MPKHPKSVRSKSQSRIDAKTSITRKARALLRIAEKLARQAKREAERYNRQQQNINKRKFRSAWSKLRKAGIVSKDARTVSYSTRNKKIVAEYEYILTGANRTFKVKTKAEQEALKAQGVQIKNGRAIVSKNYIVRNGKVFKAGNGKSRVRKLTGDDVEQAVRKAFRDLKPKHGLAFKIWSGYDSYMLYPNADTMIFDLKMGGYKYDKLTPADITFYDPRETFEEYQQQRYERQLERQLVNEAGEKLKRRQRDQIRRSMRG